MAQRFAKISDSEAAELVKARVDLRGESPERTVFDRAILRNRAFLFGKQNFVEDGSGRLKDPTSIPANRVLYRANYIKGDLLRAILTVTGANGEFVVPPNDNTRKARHAAWVSTKLFEHITRLLGMDEKSQVATMFAACDGSVFWKPIWDPEKGEPDRYYEPPELNGKALTDVAPETAKLLEEAGHFRDIPPGEVGVELWPALQVDWDFRAREGGVYDCRFISTKQAVSMEFIEEHWPRLAKNVTPDESLEGSLYYNEAIAFMASSYAPLSVYRARQDQKEHQVILAEYWERPSSKNGGMGRRIVYAGGAILENGPNTYRRTNFPLPFVKQDWVTAIGRFLGLSLVEDLTSLQKQHNNTAAKLLEHVNVYGAPPMFVPNGSGIPPGNYTVLPGAVYEYDPMKGKIETGPTPNMPKEAGEIVALTRQAMAEISSQQSLDGSKLPGQLRSGLALETVFDERNKMLGHPAVNFLLAKGKVGQQLLEIAHDRYPPERVIKYVGDDKKFRVLSFMMADVQTDLRVIIDRSKLLTSPSATRARVMEMIQIGAVDPINNPEDRIAVFKALEFGGVDELITDRLQEEENQEREIEEMKADPAGWIQPRADMMAPQSEDGQPRIVQGYPTNPFDDDQSHVRVLLRFMRSEEYRELDPITQSLLGLHLQEHQGKIQQAMMEQMMMQEALQGAPGQKGKPSAPKAQAVA